MRGTFIAVEGSDGSGKETQFRLLGERLQKTGYDILAYDFPRYDKPSSYFIHRYLNGLYGTSEEVGPYVGSLFYAVDRYDASQAIEEALESGKVVLVNRFTPSNMAYQGAKIDDEKERRNFFLWVDNLEFKMMGIPRPDASLVLHVPAEIAGTLMTNGSLNAERPGNPQADPGQISKSVRMYDEVCRLFPNEFKRIDCVRGGKLLDVDIIHNLLWETVRPMLPSGQSKGGAHRAKTKRPNPYVVKTDTGSRLTTAGLGLLQSMVTDTKDNVYGLTNILDTKNIAAVMAQLARHGADLRTIVLDQMAEATGKNSPDIRQAITEYGDDSIKQMVGMHLVVEDASELLASKLERGRLASYLEGSAHYADYAQKDTSGRYKYYVPEYLDDKVRSVYVATMDQIFELYSSMTEKLSANIGSKAISPDKQSTPALPDDIHAQAREALRGVLPVAIKSTVAIYASGQSLEKLITRLLSDELSEAFEIGQKLLTQARRIIPEFSDIISKSRANTPITNRAGVAKTMRNLVHDYLPAIHSEATDSVELVDVWPKNELDLVPEMLYEHSDMSIRDIQKEVANWTYDKKLDVFRAYLGERLDTLHKPGRALEKAHYSWDLVCDYDTFRVLQRHRMVDNLEWQLLTPRHGYDVPVALEEAGLEDDYQRCFDLSLGLYSALQQAGYTVEAQYAALLGHKIRWKVTYNVREAFHLHQLSGSKPVHRGRQRILSGMHEKIAEIHPTLAGMMELANRQPYPAQSLATASKPPIQATSS